MSRPAAPQRPLGPGELRAAWTAALAEADPERALMLRRGERLHAELPAVIGGVRRDGFVEADGISSTWEGVAVESGARARLRVLDPSCVGTPASLGRFAAPRATGATALTDPLPCLRCEQPGPSLGQIVEDDDLHAESTVYRWAATGLSALAGLHAEGVALGPLVADLRLDAAGLRCVHLGADGPRAAISAEREDLREFAALLSRLSAEPPGPLRALLAGWAEDPPPSAQDAGLLLQQTMALSLTERRHRLALRHRNRQSRDRRATLRALLERLSGALPPPQAELALRCAPDGLLTLARSDAAGVYAATAEGGGPRAWAPVWTADAGLDAPRARALMRAWATRARGDEARRAALNAELHADDHDGERLVRWLSAVARLRAARLLLAHR